MFPHRVQPLADIRLGKKVNFLIRKVDGALAKYAHFKKLLRDRMDALRELARERAKRTPRRLARGAVDEIEDRLRLGQVYLPVDESALRELARASAPSAKGQHPFKQHVEHHRATMPLQFQHVLAGKRMRPLEPDRNALIKRYAVRVAKTAKDRPSRCEFPTRQRLRYFRGQGPGHAHNADAAPPRRGRDRSYGIDSRHGARDTIKRFAPSLPDSS